MNTEFKCDSCDSVSGVLGASGSSGETFISYKLEKGWKIKWLNGIHYLVTCPLCVRRNKINKIIETIK